MRLFLLHIYLLLALLAFQARAQQFPGSVGGATNRPGTFPGTSQPGQPGQPGQSAFGSSGNGKGGIDDSTKVIYGPTSTRFFLESDLFNNRKTLYVTDTLLAGVEQYSFVERSQNRYQDFGTLGTPMRPVFYEAPTQTGAQTGYSRFSPYAYQTDQIRYYDTKSPFTNMYLVLGGRNQNILNFDFNQNITPRWNAGFNIQRFTSQKQFGTSGSNDSQRYLAQNWGFLAHTNYRSKDNKYILLLHFNHMNHQLADQGGLLPGTKVTNGDTTTVVYNYEDDARARLSAAATNEHRNDWHLYHQYELRPAFQLWHRFNYRRHINTFTDSPLTSTGTNQLPDSQFYPSLRTDSTRMFQDARYRLYENYFGTKGIYQYKGSAFNYRLFFHQRIYNQTTRYNTSATREGSFDIGKLENFVGGWLGYYLPDSTSRLTAELEYQIAGGYRLQAQLESKFGTVGYTSLFAAPTLVQQRFQSNVYFWDNTSTFGLRGTQHLFGRANLNLKPRGGKATLQLNPSIDYFLLSNYTYFGTDALPTQLKSAISLVQVGAAGLYQSGRFQASGQGYYTANTNSDVLRMPNLFLNARVQYEFIYAKVLHIQAGLDLHYKSRYKADAYMPLTGQFYLQNKQEVEGYVLADAFANFRVNRVRLFVKFSHVNQGIISPGYFVAPGFIQMRRAFGFGVDWYLFD